VEEPDLLAEMEDETAAESNDDDEDFDLLDDLTEDNGTAWYPWDQDDQPDGIQGIVKYRSTIPQDLQYVPKGQEPEQLPYLEIQDKDDPDMLWAVRGYATVLRSQIERGEPEVGDFIAIKYFGEREGKVNDYKNFKVVVRHKK
jgi:hypothetical protein